LYAASRSAVSIVALTALLSYGSALAQLGDDQLEALDERATKPYLGEPLKDPDNRFVYVLTVYDKTNFFIDDEGHYRGYEYDLLKGYEKSINRKKKASQRHYLVFVPMRFEDILPALAAGRGDIAAANLTITDERQKIVDFAKPYLTDVNEIVVTNRDEPALDSVNDLAGRSLYVLAGSSYVEHLKVLNERFVSQGLEPMDIVEADPDLEQADILELLNSGIVKLTVVDSHVANVWAPVFANIVLKPEVAVNRGGSIAWAVRKNIPAFKASVDAYVKKIREGTLIGNMTFNNYYKSHKWVRNPDDPIERAKLQKVVKYMKKYAERYGWDWIAIAAQAYQESQLDQSKVSPAGAVGIMQLLPRTAAHEPIGIKDITKVENNIHAGVKYMDHVLNSYFDDPAIAPADRVDFTWAAYNAGPARIQGLRRRAAKRGYDPNRWFNNVEHMAAESIGRQTVDYVGNINKYYVAYKFAIERESMRVKARNEHARKAQNKKNESALRAWRRVYAQHGQ
jgi:membrane-bound lytic murein transglycosylase MltF